MRCEQGHEVHVARIWSKPLAVSVLSGAVACRFLTHVAAANVQSCVRRRYGDAGRQGWLGRCRRMMVLAPDELTRVLGIKLFERRAFSVVHLLNNIVRLGRGTERVLWNTESGHPSEGIEGCSVRCRTINAFVHRRPHRAMSVGTASGQRVDNATHLCVQMRTKAIGLAPDGDRITCGGAMASFDLALNIIGDQCGEAIRLDVAALFLHETSQPFGDMEHKSVRSKLVLRALVIMDQNIEEPIPIPSIADRLGSSMKSLHRRFVQNLGTTPGKVYRYRRLVAVRSLVENTNLSIAEITTRCGYESASSMTRAFKQQFGTTPVALRIIAGG